MHDMPVFAADLKEKVASRGWTQDEFAARYPNNPEHTKKVVRGGRPITLSFALECVREFGSITVKQGEQHYMIFPVTKNHPDPNNIPDDEELHDLTDAEHNLNVMQQAEDVVKAMQRLVSSPLLLRSDSELSDALRVTKYKELHELDWALRGRIREGMQLHPHLVEEGLRQALAERPGCVKEGDAVGTAA